MIATCTQLDIYRQGLSTLAQLSGDRVTASARSATEQRVSQARAAGVPESLIITAILVPQNAWEAAAANLIDVVVPSELMRIQDTFRGGGACAAGQGEQSSGVVIPDLGLDAFRIPPPPVLPSVESLGELASAGTTSVQAPPVAVSAAQGGTVSAEASTTESLGQTTRPVLDVIPSESGNVLTGLPGVSAPPPPSATSEGDEIGGGILAGTGAAVGAAVAGVSGSTSIGIGLAVLALVALFLLSRKGN